MSYTFTEYQNEGAAYVDSPDDNEVLAVAGSGLNSCVNRFNGFNWSWTIETSGITLVAGQSDYTIPSGVKSCRALRTSTGDRIGFLPREVFNTDHPDYTESGDPREYTHINNYTSPKVRLSSAPNAAYIASVPTMTLEYYARIPNLTTSGAKLNLAPEVEETIMDFVRQFMAMRYDKDTTRTRYKAAQQAYQEGFQRLYAGEMDNQVQDQE
jgi:hypothetical protein